MALTIPYFAAQVMEKASLISQLVWLTLSVLFLSYDSVLVQELGYLGYLSVLFSFERSQHGIVQETCGVVSGLSEFLEPLALVRCQGCS